MFDPLRLAPLACVALVALAAGPAGSGLLTANAAPQDGGTPAPADRPATDGSSQDGETGGGEPVTSPASDSSSGATDEAPGRQPQRFVRARSGGVTVRNLADVHGVPLADVRSDELLAVYSETAGWLEVDVPGGLPVWVFGRYLQEVEGSPGVLEVTRNNVNMRPRPGSDVNNFPLMVRLVAGDQVAVIAKENEDAPLDETWVQIWAPPGACGFVQAERTASLPAAEDGAALWQAAETALATGVEPSGRGRAERSESASASNGTGSAGVTEASAPAPGALAAREALAAADDRFEIERERERPDFEFLRDAYGRVSALDADGALSEVVANKLETVEALEEVWRTRVLLEEQRVERQRELARRQREEWERLRERDPFYGHFAVRGLLQSYQGTDGVASYRIVRGGQARAVVQCASGRYELELFVGREIGLDGGFRVGTDAAAGLDLGAAEFVADLPTIDVTSIEILE
ncbi:hypothetical protein Pla163_24800 [Planctomycetes bacterium Pla163]|uniref:Bacterial SH3 domain protein n=1 Tax=Rohdeia mirabilis TaxID=2528008 RepID=A0A518D1K1_9BACT|nr:hypothetical protein Pla163_24800 [Planctomycetes bacterium Pla163]